MFVLHQKAKLKNKKTRFYPRVGRFNQTFGLSKLRRFCQELTPVAPTWCLAWPSQARRRPTTSSGAHRFDAWSPEKMSAKSTRKKKTKYSNKCPPKKKTRQNTTTSTIKKKNNIKGLIQSTETPKKTSKEKTETTICSAPGSLSATIPPPSFQQREAPGASSPIPAPGPFWDRFGFWFSTWFLILFFFFFFLLLFKWLFVLCFLFRVFLGLRMSVVRGFIGFL